MNAWLGWFLQRTSGVLMMVLFPVLVVSAINNAPFGSFEAYSAWIGQTHVVITLILLFVAMLPHAWVGVKDIVWDYVPKITKNPVGLSAAMGAYAGLLVGGVVMAMWIGVV